MKFQNILPSKLIFLVLILSALSFNHAFNFHLFVDDWYQILASLHYPEIFRRMYLQLHPVSVLEFKLFAPFFQFNPFPWQFLGYLLKVVDSLSMWPLMIALTNSKKAAFYACLIFSVFVVGIESVSWASAHSSAIIIPLISLGFYFWIKSENSKSKKYFSFALALFAMSMLAEPGRAFVIIIICLLWELMSLYQNISLKKTSIFFLRIGFLALLAPLIGLAVYKYFGTTVDLAYTLKQASQVSFNQIFQSLENPLFGWLLLPKEIAFWSTLIFLLATILISIIFIWKRTKMLKIIIFLSLWIPLFYLPNFISQNHAKSGIPMESRYYAISAVGIVGLLAYYFSFFNSKYIKLIIPLFLLFNIYVTNSLLMKNSVYRSTEINNKIWDKIDKDVPQGEKTSIFMYSGEDSTQRSKILDWMDTIPFAVKRGILKKEEYPIMTSDKDLIARLICEKNISRHSPFFEDIVQKEPIPLSHIHAWELKNGELVERSEEERGSVKAKAKCLQTK